jgi:hypothetical protein
MGVRVEHFPVDKTFPNAISRTALDFACAGDILTLERTFDRFDRIFDAGLVRNQGNQICHIWYEASMPGFRADPDDWPVSELHFDVNTLSYFSFRESVVGDSLDIARQVLPEISRSLDVTLGIAGQQGKDWREEATELHFPESIHHFRFRDGSGAYSANPWAQDYLKSGRVGGKGKIMITRSLFEGSRENGQRFKPLLKSLDGSRTIHSNISWEGGDLLFVQHPLNPGKLILFFGDAAKAYWGQGLTDGEYAYVLKTEFGADYAIDMSGLESHVDYALAFLPRQKVALVSEPVRNNLEVAKAAWEYLRQNYPHVQAPELSQIDEIFRDGESAVSEQSEHIDQLLRQLRSRDLSWSSSDNRELVALTNAHVQEHCPAELADCLRVDRENRILRTHAGLMDEWVTASLTDWTDHRLPDRLMAITASQLPSNSAPPSERREAKVTELERLGFGVIRVPKIAGNGELGVPWAGISYVNSLFVDPVLFVPNIGLGLAEIHLIEDVKRKLPASVGVVPVYAQNVLLYNGGIHCAAGIGRAAIDDAGAQPKAGRLSGHTLK